MLLSGGFVVGGPAASRCLGSEMFGTAVCGVLDCGVSASFGGVDVAIEGVVVVCLFFVFIV